MPVKETKTIDQPDWVNKHITTQFIAWDETQSHILGQFDTYKDAKQAILDYAKTLEGAEHENHKPIT